MIATLVLFAIRLGIAPRFANAAVIAALFVMILGALGTAKCAYDRSIIKDHEAKIEHRARPATDKAAEERARDVIATAQHEKELHDAIAAQPDQPISPTSHALACKRLRDAGRDPPACR